MPVDDSPREAIVHARVRPRSRPGLRWRQGQLVISVAAPPLEGRATEEARRALAAALGVRPGAVSVRSGARSRAKVFVVAGLGDDDVTERLDRLSRAGS